MKKTFLFVFSLLFLQTTFAQEGLPSFGDWIDDNNFYIQNPDKENSYTQINAKNGEKSEYKYSPEARFSDMMPKGYSLNSESNYHISSDGRKAVFRKNDDLFHFDKESKKVRQLTSNPAKENNPRFSPDGSKVAFTRDKNLFVIDLESGLEKQLTSDGGGLIYNGWASWVYFEEILGRSSRYRAFYWSPDNQRIAYMRFDDNGVPNFPIYHHDADDFSHGYLEMTSYPKSGDPNPLVELGVVNIEDGETQWVQKDKSLEYLAWAMWTPDGKDLLYQQQNRDQNVVKMYKANLEGGTNKIIYEESQPTWVEWFEHIDFLNDGKEFIIRSNRDGWYNLYRYDLEGNLLGQITDHDFRVNRILQIDEDNKRVFYQATGANPVERHIFVADFKGKKQSQLTSKAGTHTAHVSPTGDYILTEFNAFDNPGEMALIDSKGKELQALGKETTDVNKKNGLRVEFFTVPTSDGFDLPAYWVLPPNFDENKKYPVIFNIYGGPDAGTVYNRYSDYSWNPIYQEPIIQFTVDHRASGKFGKKGLDYMHRSLGQWEMHDYIEAVKWLRTKSFVDADRMGMQGWSYGGYMTSLALTYAADYFTHGVAGGSVTDWRLYDNIYTERFMDEPKDNKEGYDKGSVLQYVDKLEGKLLLIHGVIDDNVHMQNTMILVSKLQDAGKDFELMLYPGGRHGIRGMKGRHNFINRINFWRKHFLGEEAQ